MRPAMPRWSVGRVTLLGDACHPTLPFLGQGAVMAIEDAYVLAACIARHAGDPAAAFARYEAERRARTAAVVQRSLADARERGQPRLRDARTRRPRISSANGGRSASPSATTGSTATTRPPRWMIVTCAVRAWRASASVSTAAAHRGASARTSDADQRSGATIQGANHDRANAPCCAHWPAPPCCWRPPRRSAQPYPIEADPHDRAVPARRADRRDGRASPATACRRASARPW